MNKYEKAKQLTQKGEGYGTAIMCPTLKTPFIIIGATPDDLMSLLVVCCGLEPEIKLYGYQHTSKQGREGRFLSIQFVRPLCGPCAACPNTDFCRDINTCQGEIMDEAAEIMSKPPCCECGAMTAKEAEVRCKCGGDRDHCHGCDLWPNRLSYA